MAEENKLIRPVEPDYDAVFGRYFAPTPEEESMPARINDMLQAQWQTASDQRTNAHKLAQVTALGNVLQNIFTPVAWGAGGHGKATSQPIAPDNRAYITAFNEAIKADQDLANVGAQGRQTMLNYQMNEIAQDRARREKRANAAVERERRKYEMELGHYNRMLETDARYQWRKDIEKTKADLRAKYKSGIESKAQNIDTKLFVDAVADARRAYRDIKKRLESGLLPEGATLPDFRTYFVEMFPEWESQYDSYIQGERTVNKPAKHAEL